MAISAIENLPDVSFIDDMTLDDVQAALVTAYQERYAELTGSELTLRRASAESLKLYAVGVMLYQVLLSVDMTGKMDLLKYAYGDFLDNLGALRSVTRLEAGPATCTIRFTLSAEQENVVTIEAGTRVSDGGDLYFEVDEDTEIAAGDTYADAACTCQTDGEEGNGYTAGMISTIVDPIAYVESAANIDETSGGSDIEDDESFAERIYLAPSSYSTAGSKDSYIYYAKSYSTAIGDVEVTSPEPCEVEVRILMDDGTLPSETVLAGVAEILSADDVRPLTDQVTVLAPSVQSYDIELTYYINQSDESTAETIQEEVDAAIDEYILWQSSTIGRDINPSALIRLIIAAGAKRAEITSPTFEAVPEGYVAQLNSQTVTYGGLEDD